MKVSAEESLWLAFPILIVVVVLIGSIIYLQNSNTDIRGRASEPLPVVTQPAIPVTPQAPEVVCTDIYQPVCGINGQTYSNQCEANLAGVNTFTEGVCIAPTQISLPDTP